MAVITAHRADSPYQFDLYKEPRHSCRSLQGAWTSPSMNRAPLHSAFQLYSNVAPRWTTCPPTTSRQNDDAPERGRPRPLLVQGHSVPSYLHFSFQLSTFSFLLSTLILPSGSPFLNFSVSTLILPSVRQQPPKNQSHQRFKLNL